MKKIIYAIGLVLPGIATKALAQQMKLPDIKEPERFRGSPLQETNLSPKELDTIDKYENCSPRERAVFLFKVMETSKENESSTMSEILRQHKIEQILILPEQEQQEQLLEMIRNGGMRWGSIGEPSDKCGF